jgi:hypothetical protein
MKMKIVAVMPLQGWKETFVMRVAIAHLNSKNKTFRRLISQLCEKTIPDAKNWGPAEAYHQEIDKAYPICEKNWDKTGFTICHSQLLKKENRDLQTWVVGVQKVIYQELYKIGVTTQLFSETHVSDVQGKSEFIPVETNWIKRPVAILWAVKYLPKVLWYIATDRY